MWGRAFPGTDPIGAEALSWLFDGRAVVRACRPSADPPPLWSGEAAAVAGASPTRIAEFASGRACARHAMEALTGRAVAIPAAPDRSPIWPPGSVGSISHCATLCCAALARQGVVQSLGVDVEPMIPLPVSAALICNEEELEGFELLPVPSGTDWAMIAFVAKEAFYKCQYALTHRFLDFRDGVISFVCPTPCGGRGFFTMAVEPRLTPWSGHLNFQGRWLISSGHILAGAALLAS